MQVGELKAQSIQARVTEGVREQITSGELESGAALSEIALAEEFGVSRTPVREALKQLQTEGLLVIRPRVGTFVSSPSRLEINELFQVKEILEGAATRLFAVRGDVPELDELRRNVRRADESVGVGDAATYALLVEDFHEIIIRGSGNNKLAQHYRMMMNQLAYRRLVTTSLSKPGRLVESESEHNRVLEIIAAKDGTTAERVMREHVRASQEALLDAMVFPDERPTAPRG
jgi:DNA-binding GntR family transcriptional regulator